MTSLDRFALVFGALCAAGAAAAPPAAAAGTADPLNAEAAIAPARHVSPFARYRPSGEVSPGSWRQANETVARIGGWRAYAREAAAPEAALPEAASSRPAPGREPGHPR